MLHRQKVAQFHQSYVIYHNAHPKIEEQSLELFFFFIDRVLRIRSRNDSRPLPTHMAGPGIDSSCYPDLSCRCSPLQLDIFQGVFSKQSILCDKTFKYSLQRHLRYPFSPKYHNFTKDNSDKASRDF